MVRNYIRKSQRGQKITPTAPEVTMEAHKIYRPDDIISVNLNAGISHQNFSIPRYELESEGQLTYGQYRHNVMASYYNNILKSLDVKSFTFYLECSQYGLYHLHGWVRIKNSEEFASWVGQLKYNESDFRIDIDTINDMKVWKNYISKDYDIIKQKYSFNDNDPSLPLG